MCIRLTPVFVSEKKEKISNKEFQKINFVAMIWLTVELTHFMIYQLKNKLTEQATNDEPVKHVNQSRISPQLETFTAKNKALSILLNKLQLIEV